MDYLGRASKLVEAFDADTIDGFLCSRLIHARYFTGYSGSNGAAGISQHGVVVVTDSRYDLQVRAESPHCHVIIDTSLGQSVLKHLAGTGSTRIGVEKDWLSLSEFEALQNVARELQVELVPVSGLVEALRIIKEPAEIDAIATACSITSQAWSNVIERGVVGKTELALAASIEAEFRYLGAEDRAFESIVATGSNSAIPHHHPTSRVVEAGHLLKMDIGARVEGYHADMTRTVVVGVAQDWQMELYAAVSAAQQAALAIARAGADSQTLWEVIDAQHVADGYGDFIMHRPGHGVGLEIHEKPFLGRRDGILQPRMPITVEPGLYLPGRGGVRIEDTIEILPDGYRYLTNANRDFITV